MAFVFVFCSDFAISSGIFMKITYEKIGTLEKGSSLFGLEMPERFFGYTSYFFRIIRKESATTCYFSRVLATANHFLHSTLPGSRERVCFPMFDRVYNFEYVISYGFVPCSLYHALFDLNCHGCCRNYQRLSQ